MEESNNTKRRLASSNETLLFNDINLIYNNPYLSEDSKKALATARVSSELEPPTSSTSSGVHQSAPETNSFRQMYEMAGNTSVVFGKGAREVLCQNYASRKLFHMQHHAPLFNTTTASKMNITIPTAQAPPIETAETTTTTQPNPNHQHHLFTTNQRIKLQYQPAKVLVPKEKKDEINGGALGDRFSSSTARELIPTSCVGAEAYFLLVGPTTKQEKSNANKSRLKPGYKSKLYKCKFEKCTMYYWLL
jgi:hypothetical protein